MTAYRVAELDGALLDAAVAKAEEDLHVMLCEDGYGMAPGTSVCMTKKKRDKFALWHRFAPSTDWSRAGPIIERERIDVLQFENGAAAFCGDRQVLGKGGCLYNFELMPEDLAPSPLIAAMRAYVASKFGDTVDLP